MEIRRVELSGVHGYGFLKERGSHRLKREGVVFLPLEKADEIMLSENDRGVTFYTGHSHESNGIHNHKKLPVSVTETVKKDNFLKIRIVA